MGDIVPLEKHFYPALSGRTKRRMKRQNTVHLRAICPECGKDGMKYHKYLNGKCNVWYCTNCKKIFPRNSLEYTKYV